MFYDKLNDHGALVVRAICEPVLGLCKVTTDLMPPGSRAACIKFKRVYNNEADWDYKIAHVIQAGLNPDVVNHYGIRSCDTAFVGRINEEMIPASLRLAA